MPSSILFLLEENCNSVGLRLMNIKSLNAKDFINSEILISINLEENIFAGAISTLKISESFWFDSYVPEIALKYDIIAPVNSHYEVGGTFLNLESRPQNAMKLDTNMNTLRPISSIFTAIKNTTINSVLFLKYIKEKTENAKYFNILENKFLNLCNATNQNLIMKIDFYPSKASIENYYTKNSSCKKSLTMLNRSQETKGFFTNFL
jgi:NADH dehydrogenase/NADH:ubiquinone oxidoreductase subunit G